MARFLGIDPHQPPATPAEPDHAAPARWYGVDQCRITTPEQLAAELAANRKQQGPRPARGVLEERLILPTTGRQAQPATSLPTTTENE